MRWGACVLTFLSVFASVSGALVVLQQMAAAPDDGDDDDVANADDEGGDDEQCDGDRGQIGLRREEKRSPYVNVNVNVNVNVIEDRQL